MFSQASPSVPKNISPKILSGGKLLPFSHVSIRPNASPPVARQRRGLIYCNLEIFFDKLKGKLKKFVKNMKICLILAVFTGVQIAGSGLPLLQPAKVSRPAT